MRRDGTGACALTLLAIGVACSSSTRVQIPPRMDLRSYGTVGMIRFSSEETEDLSRQASQEFLSNIQSAQPGVAVLELGDAKGVLASLGAGTLDVATIRRIGDAYGVDVIIFGVLETKEVRPRVSIGSILESVSARAEIEGSLDAKMFDTRNGATIWTKSARCQKTVASLSVSEGGVSAAGADHPDTAREKLVRVLVAQTTEDFWPSYVRQ
jgi:hypothetical protein